MSYKFQDAGDEYLVMLQDLMFRTKMTNIPMALRFSFSLIVRIDGDKHEVLRYKIPEGTKLPAASIDELLKLDVPTLYPVRLAGYSVSQVRLFANNNFVVALPSAKFTVNPKVIEDIEALFGKPTDPRVIMAREAVHAARQALNDAQAAYEEIVAAHHALCHSSLSPNTLLVHDDEAETQEPKLEPSNKDTKSSTQEEQTVK